MLIGLLKNWFINKLMARFPEKISNWATGSLSDQLFNWLTNRETNWPTEQLSEWPLNVRKDWQNDKWATEKLRPVAEQNANWTTESVSFYQSAG